MNAATRNALTMLQKHKQGVTTNKKTTVDGRGKGAKVKINYTTAYALEARDLVTIDDSSEPHTVELTQAGIEYTFD